MANVSVTQKYRNCIRLNCAQPWSAELEKSLIALGGEVQRCLESSIQKRESALKFYFKGASFARYQTCN